MKRILILVGVLVMSNWKVMVGGIPLDLEDDYGLHVSRITGTGSPRSTLSLDRYALIPGGEVSAAKVQPRTFTLAGTLTGSSTANLHALRQALVTLFSEPRTIRYIGATTSKDITAYYKSGLEFNQQVEEPCHWERLAIEFTSPYPFWEEITEESETLDSNDAVSYYTISRRLHEAGVWDNIGPPNPLSGFHTIMAMARAANGDIYIGGHFWNWDNNINGQNIARWDAATSTWQPLGVGLDDAVRGIAIDSNGLVYIVGEFTDLRTNPGGGTYNYIICWDPVTSTWSALGAGLDADVYTVSIGFDGTVYVGGWFNNAGGNPAMYVAQWDGAVWSAVDVGLNSHVYASTVGPNGGIYLAGNFNDLFGGPGQTYSRLARWNPDTSTWTSLTSGRIINGHVNAITVYKNGCVYFGGDFDTIDAETFNNVGKWNGTALATLGSGVDDEVTAIAVGPDGLLYLGGRMDNAGTVPARRLAIWNGYVWTFTDLIMPNVEAIFSIMFGDQDPDIPENYDVYLGSATPLGSEQQAGIATVTNDGTAPVYPTITFARAGGTSAKVLSIRNETTGKVLYLNYNLLDNEVITLTLSPTSKSVVSDYFGKIPNAVLPGGDFGTFALAPGDNDITCFVNVAGGPVITATMTWHNTYRSFD